MPEGKEIDARLREELSRTREFFDKTRSGEVRLSPVQMHIFAATVRLMQIGDAGRRAVDLGCHWGRYTKVIAQTYGSVIGVDVSEKAIASAERADNVRYVIMDLNAQESGLRGLAPVDFFFANAVMEMIESPERLCCQMAEAAASGAVVVAVIPNRHSLNYMSFRCALWVATRLFGKKGGIYNNGISIARLLAALRAAGFEPQGRGAIVGVPAYLLGVLPWPLQRMFLRLDGVLLRLIGGSYHWVRATRVVNSGEQR